MVLIAGWPELSDVYTSTDGSAWELAPDLAWNCTVATRDDACGKFDFWPVVHRGRLYTAGGSGARSTFGHLYADTWVFEAPEAEVLV